MTTPEEFRARRDRWTAKLRSGEITQGKGKLRQAGGDDTPDAYCCLGVACELYREEVGGEWTDVARDLDLYFNPGDGSRPRWGDLPRGVSEWLGFDEGYCYAPDPRVVAEWDGSTGPRQLSVLNDGGFTFAQIADLIDTQFP